MILRFIFFRMLHIFSQTADCKRQLLVINADGDIVADCVVMLFSIAGIQYYPVFA
ncbi:hypothetical protein D3C81_2226500 [compost metagenome]